MIRKYTEGEWTACLTEARAVPNIKGYSISVDVFQGQQLPIADCFPSPHEPATDIANASLISAAPNLLKALTSAAISLAADTSESSLCQEIRAAMRKALNCDDEEARGVIRIAIATSKLRKK